MMTTGKRLLPAILCISLLLAVVGPPTALAAGTMTIDPTSGTPGTRIYASGGGWPSNTYFYLWFDTNGNGVRDSGESYRSTRTTSTGELPSGTSGAYVPSVPNVASGNYNVLLDVSRDGSVDASAVFTVAPGITLSPTSGNAGTVITITGKAFPASASGYIWFDTNNDSVMDAAEPQVAVTVSGTGDIPSGTMLTVPVTSPGTYYVRADIPNSDATIEASASFSYVTRISISPTSGYTGMTIDVTGNGFIPYAAGNVWFDTNGDSVMDATEPQVAVTVSDIGAFPSGVTLPVPATSPGTYYVRADIPTGDSTIEASASFSYVIRVTISPDRGYMWKEIPITVTGGGFTPNEAGDIWFDTNGNSIMDDDEPQVAIPANEFGIIPAGTTLVTPLLEPNKVYRVRFDIPSGGPVEASPAFTTSTTSTGVRVNKYDAYGTLLDTKTATYQWMEANLPVYGDDVTPRFMHGPTFDNSAFELVWDIVELVNWDTRNYGVLKGTDLKDVCELVGSQPGDTVQVKATDNFNKWFDYEDIYNPEPEQGKMVLGWFNGKDAPSWGGDYQGLGYPDGCPWDPAEYYRTAIRLVFFAETLCPDNPLGPQYVFGDWDMHETLPESRWHYYYGSPGFWPSSSGLSVQNVYNINIYQPNLISCDASGIPQDKFAPGDTLYVKGLGMTKDTSYKLWIQTEPVSNNKLTGIPGVYRYGEWSPPELLPAYTFNAANDPSGTQETVTTDANGDFAPLAIWSIDPSAAFVKYDIVADSQTSGTVGKYDVYTAGSANKDFIDEAGWQGISVEVTYETISSLVKHVVTKDGVVNALISHLKKAEKAKKTTSEAKHIREFIKVVEAQTGKCISPEDADLLIYLVNSLSQNECGECKGKVNGLELKYNGSTTDATITVLQKDGKEVFNGTVQPGDTFSFSGQDKQGTLGTEIALYIDSVLNTKIHTSCSQPIGPGLISGDFEVIAGTSKDGGELCPVT
jgi:hypothetical protein